MSEARIRAATAEDVHALPGIEGRAAARFADVGVPGAVSLPLHEVSALLVAATEARLLVAADGGNTPIGFAVLEAHADGDAHLLELDVEPAWSGKGVGRALVAASADWARARGKGRLTLTTFRDVPFNAPFYARIGFSVVSENEPRLAGILANEVAHGVAIAPRVAMAMRL